MANWNSPVLTDLYTNFLSYLKDRDDDAVRLNDTRVTAGTNLPEYAKRWNHTIGALQYWFSSAWINLVLSIQSGGTGGADAGTARTNLDVFSKGEGDARYETPAGATAKVATHANIGGASNVHGATSAPTTDALMKRDASGRAQVTAPSVGGDIATKQTVDDHAILQTAHGSTSAPTPNKIAQRNANGRAQFADPLASADADTKGARDAAIAAAITNLDVTVSMFSAMYFLRVDTDGTILASKGDTTGVSVVVDPNSYGDTSHYRILDSRVAGSTVAVASVSESYGMNLDGTLETINVIVIPALARTEVHIRNSATGVGSAPRPFNIWIAV